MKNILFIFITLIIFVDITHASFPVSNVLTIKQEDIKNKSIENSILSYQKMKSDLQLLELEDYKIEDDSSNTNISSDNLFVTGAILFFFSLITFVISMLDFVKCTNRIETCNNSGVPYFVLSFVFFWSSIICFIVRRKRRNS